MNQIEKISSNVFLIGSDDLSGSGDCLIYGIKLYNGDTCLIDVGTGHMDQILLNISQETTLNALKINHIILTHAHYDHIGAAYQFKEEFPLVKFYAHDWDVPVIEGKKNTQEMTAASWYGAEYIPIKVDFIFKKELEQLILGGTKLLIYHTPGHTPGSISIVISDDRQDILFGQDIHGPFLKEFNSNIEDWEKSMKKLLALEVDILCEGHYGIFKGKNAVKKFIQSQLQQQNRY